MAAAVDQEEFTYASLVNRWRRERSTTVLGKLDGAFYEGFDAHLLKLHEEYQKEQAKNPAAPKVLILLDELTNLQRIREDLYDLRERKVLTAALIAAREGRPDAANMTRGERALYESLVRSLKQARLDLIKQESLPTIDARSSGPVSPPDPAPPVQTAQAAAPLADRSRLEAAPEAPLPGAPVAAPRQGAQPPTFVEAAEEVRKTAARVLVRIRADVDPFVAPDLRHYRLAAEDVAALPREVAHLLIQRGLATALGG